MNVPMPMYEHADQPSARQPMVIEGSLFQVAEVPMKRYDYMLPELDDKI